jgi:hypothetical protein
MTVWSLGRLIYEKYAVRRNAGSFYCFCPHFTFLNAADATRTGSFSTPGTVTTTDCGNSAFSTYNPGGVETVVKPGQDVLVRFCKVKCSGLPASEILQNLGPRYLANQQPGRWAIYFSTGHLPLVRRLGSRTPRNGFSSPADGELNLSCPILKNPLIQTSPAAPLWPRPLSGGLRPAGAVVQGQTPSDLLPSKHTPHSSHASQPSKIKCSTKWIKFAKDSVISQTIR